MAQDAVKRVALAEKAAIEKVALAREQAKQIVADAEKKGKDLLAEAEIAAEREVHEMLIRADQAAKNAAEDIINRARTEGEKLEALAAGKMARAAAVIAERVVNG